MLRPLGLVPFLSEYQAVVVVIVVVVAVMVVVVEVGLLSSCSHIRLLNPHVSLLQQLALYDLVRYSLIMRVVGIGFGEGAYSELIVSGY